MLKVITALIFISSFSSPAQDIPEGAKKFAKKFTDAIFSNDPKEFVKLYHISTVKCIEDKYKDYYVSRVRNYLDHSVGNEKVYEIVSLKPYENNKQREAMFKKLGLRNSTTPTHSMQIDIGRDKTYPWVLKAKTAIALDLHQEKSSWKLVGFCITDKAMEAHLKSETAQQERKAKVNELYAKINVEKKNQYFELLKNGKTSEADEFLKALLPKDTSNQILYSLKFRLSDELIEKIKS